MSNKKELSSVQGLDDFIAERRLPRPGSLDALGGCTLGIDLNYFISRLLVIEKREPLLHAIGGYPLAIEHGLDVLLASLKAADVKPYFVLKGLDAVSVQQSETKMLELRDLAWKLYADGEGEDAVKKFDELPVALERAAPRKLISILIEKKAGYMVAPMAPSAQLAYLMQAGYIDALYGSSEALLYDVEKVITSIDSKTSSFSFVSRETILQELGFSTEQLVEAVVVTGCDLNRSPFPPIEHIISSQSLGQITAMKAVQDLAQAHGSLSAAIQTYPDPELETPFSERFKMAVAAVQYQPVMKENGAVETISAFDVPNDIHRIIGQRLPDEFFFYLSRGVTGAELLNGLCSGFYYENAPLDGGDLMSYRSFIKTLSSIRSKAMNLLTQSMHRYYQFKPVKLVLWFENSASPLEKISPPLYATVLQKCKVSCKSVGLDNSQVNIGELLSKFTDEGLGNKERHDIPQQLKLNADIVSSAVLSTMEIFGFFQTNRKLTVWGNIYVSAMSTSPNLSEPLLGLLLLLKTGYLADSAVRKSEDGRAEDTYIRLISRVASALTLSQDAAGYTGPLDRDLLKFNSFVNAQNKCIRQVIEASIVALLANGDASRLDRGPMEWDGLVMLLPYATEVNAATGVAMRVYLESTMSITSSEAQLALQKLFKQTTGIISDIKVAFKLWDAMIVGVREASRLGVLTADIWEHFLKADAWLQERLF